MTQAASCARRDEVGRVERSVATGTRQLALGVATSDAKYESHARLVNQMELMTAPRLIILCLQALNRYFLARPLFVVEPWPDPFAVRYRITKCAEVRGVDWAAVVRLLIGIVMAFGTGMKGRFISSEFRAPMFGMAIRAGDSGFNMGFDDRRREGIRAMTVGTLCFHTAPQRVTRRAGICICASGDRRRNR